MPCSFSKEEAEISRNYINCLKEIDESTNILTIRERMLYKCDEMSELKLYRAYFNLFSTIPLRKYA